ncbi:hypothetical protein [Agromyces bauzanensis]
MAAGIVAGLLSGCIGTPAPTPSPTPSAARVPIFASDEEALAAAEEAYRSFESVSALIASESGNDAERIENVATAKYSIQLLDEFSKYRELEIRAVGQTTLDSFSLVDHRSTDDSADVVIYVCRDVSNVRVLDAAGTDVTPADRVARTPLVASLTTGGTRNLLVSGVELWSGEDFC